MSQERLAVTNEGAFLGIGYEALLLEERVGLADVVWQDLARLTSLRHDHACVL